MKRSMFAIGGCVAIALLVAACGGDDDGQTSTPVTATHAASATGAAATTDGGDEPAETDDAGGSGGEQGDLINPCDLLTNDEVAEVLGGPVDTPEPFFIDPFSECQWSATDHSFSLNVNLFRGTHDEVETYYGFATPVEEIDGIGDKAHWSVDSERLELLKGDIDIIVDAFGFLDEVSKETRQAQDRALAEKILERLP